MGRRALSCGNPGDAWRQLFAFLTKQLNRESLLCWIEPVGSCTAEPMLGGQHVI